MNRVLYLYALIVLSVAILIAVVLDQNDGPEELIIGKWKEVSWEYEKVDKMKTDTTSFIYTMNQSVSQEITKDLIIHESEEWDIQPRGRMVLAGKNNDMHIYKWRLKGWGHILKLVSDTGHFEYYQVAKLDQEQMVLVFENDMQVRGVVKITFDRIK